MKLEGMHHITAITADARRNLDFYVQRVKPLQNPRPRAAAR